MVSEWEVFLRLTLSCVLGGVIGYERQSRRKSAGLRTNMLVCLGSCLVMLLSTAIYQGVEGRTNADPARLAAQVVGHGNGREGADHDGFLWVEGAGKQPVSETRILGDGPDSRRAMLHTGPPSSDPDGCARTIVQVFLECLTESGFLYRSGPTDGRFVRRIRADE